MPTTQPVQNLHTFTPPPGDAFARITEAVSALLTALEPHEPNAPAAKAYRSAIRSRGVEAVAAGGAMALPYLATVLTKAAPDRAEVREAILELSWSGLPGWPA